MTIGYNKQKTIVHMYSQRKGWIEVNGIKPIDQLNRNRETKLLQIWESGVNETHSFLSSSDIEQIRPDVLLGIRSVEHLLCFYKNSQVVGFIGVDNKKIEMLFIDSAVMGEGIGKKLLSYAVETLHATVVDVNEQNTHAVQFYKHMGFKQIHRSEHDDRGRPFPILTMKMASSIIS
ncbi:MULTISPECIES: GNAT family N-acetyltransferase [Shouchella]|uniref:GNAT family N-acetyltransferase n=2 Tax=Shouchella TaxID=2893057 RepID=A0ABY7W9S9_9BACI|nr:MULTISPECIES: GNAT family N-acetyltransferase [Shouchella]MED4129129.1 GNAT family N-acetyltransferase [Shouchella miscanthi]WDF05672.1 GNAT family N-acetyltransferase [Shouchella hunanensis]